MPCLHGILKFLHSFLERNSRSMFNGHAYQRKAFTTVEVVAMITVYPVSFSQVCYSQEMQHIISVSFMFHCNFIEHGDTTTNKPT